MKCYQVIDRGGFPASGPHNDLAVFPTQEGAESWITHLVDECGHDDDEYRTREVVVGLPYSEGKGDSQ